VLSTFLLLHQQTTTMAIKVYGKTYFLNGQIAQLNVDATGEISINKDDNRKTTWKAKIDKGNVEIEFGSEIDKLDFLWLRHLAKDLIDNFVFAKEINELNECIVFFPEYYIDKEGNKLYVRFDKIPDVDIDIKVDENKFIKLLGSNPDFRDAVKDYHIGLFDNTNCPTHFYRMVDSFKHLIMGKEDQLTPSEFEEFQKRMGLEEQEKVDLNELYKTAIPYRHGTRKPYGLDNYSKFMKLGKIMILRTYNYLEIPTEP